MKKYYFFIILTSFCVLYIDIFLSIKFGYLSEPINTDGVAYCLKGKLLYTTFKEEGLSSFFSAMLSHREPLWDGLIGLMHIIFNSNEEKIAYVARFFPIVIFLSTVFFVASKRVKVEVAYFLVLISAFLPIVSPNIRSLFPLGVFTNYKVLADMRPDFLWGSLLTATVVYTLENYKSFNPKYFFVVGLLASLTILAKGSTAPFLFSSLGLSALYVLFKNRHLGVLPVIKGIGIGLAIVLFFTSLWWLFGGLDSNVQRIIGTYTNTQIVRDGLPYAEMIKTFFWYASIHTGFLESRVFSCIVLLFLLWSIWKRQLDVKVLLYLLIGGHVIFIMSTKNSNLLNSSPASLLFYIAGISAFCILTKNLFESNNKYLTKLSLGAIATLIFSWLAFIVYSNSLFNDKLAKLDIRPNAKAEYLEMLEEVNSYLTPKDIVYQNFYLYGGIHSMEYYLGRKIPKLGININQAPNKTIKNTSRCKAILVDKQGSIWANKVHPRRKKHYDAFYTYLNTTNDYTLKKTYTINTLKNRGIVQDALRVDGREILFYLKNDK